MGKSARAKKSQFLPVPNFAAGSQYLLSADSVDHVEVVFRTTHTQNTTNILIDHDYTMNHGGRRRTTAAMVPYTRL